MQTSARGHCSVCHTEHQEEKVFRRIFEGQQEVSRYIEQHGHIIQRVGMSRGGKRFLCLELRESVLLWGRRRERTDKLKAAGDGSLMEDFTVF